MIDVIDYVDGRGRNVFRRWFDGLDDSVQSRIAVALLRVADGNLLAAKSVGAGSLNFGWISGLGIACISGGMEST
jgi:putative component of toxin-antitoxin plasmid stabilization module